MNEMGYLLEINSLLKVPQGAGIDLNKIKVRERYKVEKQGERLYPLNIPTDICDENYRYYGKVMIRKLSLEKGKTVLEFEVVKVFDQEESRVFSKNFIRVG